MAGLRCLLSSLLSTSGPVAQQNFSPMWLPGSQTTPHGCILRRTVGMAERLSGKLSSVRSSHSKPLQTQCVPSLTPSKSSPCPAGKTYTLPLSCNFMHNCQYPKPLAPGGKPSILKTKQRQNKPKTTLFSPRRKIFLSFWRE